MEWLQTQLMAPKSIDPKSFFSPRRDAYYAGRHAKRVPDLGFLKNNAIESTG
ncbi:hypothetical protein [Burkholderia glumae]|uniref:hypothetical protein n=1 Tax=Burkholderia glumae TaxID=337 RepID=UPI0012FDF83F|nr:hypothetical protein [Burkholderia glumae]